MKELVEAVRRLLQALEPFDAVLAHDNDVQEALLEVNMRLAELLADASSS